MLLVLVSYTGSHLVLLTFVAAIPPPFFFPLFFPYLLLKGTRGHRREKKCISPPNRIQKKIIENQVDL
jgi:hypothetical protein